MQQQLQVCILAIRGQNLTGVLWKLNVAHINEIHSHEEVYLSKLHFIDF